ncbi:MAG TPA: hypothetical protein VGY66_04985, partial [Gemmataceae bacterium]|nr:hypothetical protein [Gemmataceae bacterium]
MARPPCESRGPILPAPRRKLHPRPRRRRFLEVEALEARELLAATWTPLVHQPPANIGTMLLLTDGTVMAQGTSVSKEWFQLTPDSTGSYVNGTWSQLASMSLERLYGGTAVLPSGKVLYVGGEFTGPSAMQTETNTGEIYDPVTNKWSPIAPFPERNFGDDPIVVLGNGTVLGGYNGGPQTHVYNPATNTWAAAGGPKLRGDATSEETWIKLPDGSILAADINGSNSTGVPHAQRYVPATNSWVDTGNIPVPLTNSGQEMGPGALLPDGRAVQFGSTGNSALYTPSTNQWAAGPKIPGGMSTDDAPGAILPNGHVIFKADTPPLTSPSKLFDFDPVANTITAMNVPGALSGSLSTSSAYVSRMLVLPSGELLFSDGGNQPWIYNPGTTTTAAWQPTISSVSFDNTTQIYTLTGTQLNGISEGASYGDDAQMASNYPIVRLTNSSGTVFTARTFNWSSQVATGSTPVTTQFKLPAGLPLGLYTLTAIANGIPSAPFSLPVGLTVTNSTPADGTILTAPPSVFNVTFSQAINPGSLQPGALTVNGIASSGATLDATDTVATFTFSSNPVTGQGPQTMAIAAQAVTALNNSTVVNAAFNATFFYDTLPLAIASTSPAAGAIFSPPVGSFTYDVTFNEPIDPGLVGVGNLTLSRGTVTAATLQPGNETVAYTLSGLNAEGPLTVTILAGTFKDQYD